MTAKKVLRSFAAGATSTMCFDTHGGKCHDDEDDDEDDDDDEEEEEEEDEDEED